MANEHLKAIDDQMVSWVEQLDDLYKTRDGLTRRIDEIESTLASLKSARRVLAKEWGDKSEETQVPLKYVSAGVQDAIHELFEASEYDKDLSVEEIVRELKFKGYDFGDKNPRRVVNMALVNDSRIFPASGKIGKYCCIPF